MHTDFSIQNEPACYQSPPPGWYIPCEIQTAVPFARWASTSLRMTQGWSGQGWWSLTAIGSACGAVRDVPVFAGDARLVRSVGNLVKLSPAEHQKRNRLVRSPFGG